MKYSDLELSPFFVEETNPGLGVTWKVPSIYRLYWMHKEEGNMLQYFDSGDVREIKRIFPSGVSGLFVIQYLKDDGVTVESKHLRMDDDFMVVAYGVTLKWKGVH